MQRLKELKTLISQDTYAQWYLQLKTTFVYKFIVRKYFFEIIELFQTYQKL